MRITSIKLAGSIETSKHLPRAFARICRPNGRDYIQVELIAPGGERTQHIQADSEADIRSMAERLQRTLDGYDGTNSEIEEYVRVLQHFTD